MLSTGFGGSTAEEALYYYHQLVLPAKPSILVYYEGDNDLASGYTPSEILALTHRLFECSRRDLPGIRFVIIPVKDYPAETASKDHLAALNRGPLAMGLLTNKYTANTKPALDDVRGEKSPLWMKYFKNGKPHPEWLHKRDAVCEILASNGRTIAQGALAYLWARSPKNLPIPGFCTVAQVKENAGAMQFGPLTADQMQEINRLLDR